MKSIHTHKAILSNYRVKLAVIVALILCIPLIAMQFSDQVQWSISDFIVIGALLIGGGLVYEGALSHIKTKNQRILAGVFIGLLILYLWAELAVGIFTNLGN